MFSKVGSIHPWAVVAATVASFVLGGLWFAAIFPRVYALALGKEAAPKQKPAPLFLVGPFLCGLITTLTSALLIRVLGIQSYGDALVFGAIVGFGYLAATTVNTGINPNIPRPLLYGLVSGSYFFVSNIVATLVLVALG